MKLFNVLFALSMTVITNFAFGQDTASKAPAPAKLRPYKDVITAQAVTKPGLFSVHKIDDKYYFEIPDSLLKREVLFTTRLVKVPTGSPRFGGEIVNSIIVSFEKAGEDKLYVRVITNVAVADSTNAIAKAVRNSTIDPIAMIFDIKAKKDNKSSVIEVTDFIAKDNSITGFDANAKKSMSLGAVAADRSFIMSVNPYEQNIEIKTMKTFGMGAASPAAGAAPGEAAPASTSANVGVTFELSTSIMLLPAVPMQSRHSDPRVGYYSENYKIFSDAQQKVEDKNFIVRHRMEPKQEDIQRYLKGELVEPKEPLVFYVDPATPKQWRQYIIAGINDWNEAFKAAGFKNAIIGKEWPENDSSMCMEDVRCKIVRYFPTEQSFSYGPRVYDPRSGEILQTYIGWSHSKLQSLYEWYFVQAAAVDSRARTTKFSTELMGSLIRAAVAREVGHTLGLRNNMAGSSAYPVEKLRDKKWLEANGFSASIMDNIHYNYVAQPEDHISPKDLLPKIGEYDKWAIKYGYSYTGKNNFEDDKKLVQKWTVDAFAASPALKFSPEIDLNLNDPSDPSGQTEDLSNDPVKAAEYGIKNLKIVTANLLEWTKEDMDMYDNANAMYGNVVDWYQILTRHAYTQIGGTNENLKSIDQKGDVYTLVPKDVQKRAMAFLHKEVFQTPTWLYDKNLLNKFAKPASKEKIQRFQDDAIYQVLKASVLYKMTIETMRFGKEKTYTVDEMLTDLNNGLWSELKTSTPVVIDPYRRFVQKAELVNIFRVVSESAEPPKAGSTSPDLSTTDIPVVLRVQLDKIMKQCKAAIPACKDTMTLAHLEYVYNKINKFLYPKN
ncbi:MAG: zinc-dependent metalloprotease [Bacteroidetes bacterium]|nr:MAG: zinc-dependent metalloprotease [Bacteroidota bacterium]